jgi:SRSO17 transposase
MWHAVDVTTIFSDLRGKEQTMKHPQHITFTGPRTTPTDVCRWAQELVRLHARLAPRFARPEPRRRVLAYLQGILSDISRKNSWHLAEHAREGRPDGMQRLLSQAVWDTDGVRDDLRSYALEQLGQDSAILVIDETSFPKRGKKSAGVGMQYCGTTGQVENCQVGVFLSYVTAKGHTLIDRELYLPFDWCEDRQRCQAANIPETVRFQTKPELAIQMLDRLFHAQLPIAWIVADTVYGGNLDLRTWCEQHQSPYVLAVACNEPVGIVTPDGRRRRVEVGEVEALVLHEQDWQRLSMSEGTKGPRLFDWAVVPLLYQGEVDGRHWLLIRRSLTDPQEKRYSFVFGPPSTTLPEMVKASGARWHIEEDFENAKDLGLDHYEVRSFLGWYRHITLVLVAACYLAGICATTTTGSTALAATCGSASTSAVGTLTSPEVCHLLARLIWPNSLSASRVLAWSWWRRCHQSRASYFHTKRRLKAG